LLFLQQIISGRPAKPAETLGCARFGDQKTAKKQRRQGENLRKSAIPTRIRRRQQHRIHLTTNMNDSWYHICENLSR
jgi:hypothetical protein